MVRFSPIVTLSLCLAFAVVGCNPNANYQSVSKLKTAPAAEHEHGEKGPHGGGIIELGNEEYHAELVIDHDSHSILVYILGKDAKTAAQVAASEITITPEGKDALTLKAAPDKGDAEGKTSKFQLENDELVHAWMDAGFVHGDLRMTVGENQFHGHIDYHLDGSDHHDHDHDEKKPTEGTAK